MPKVVSKDGTAIAYDKVGEGPALILVDGALCYRSFGPMGELSARLASDFTVYSYDRRGRGESGDTPPYAIEREVEDIDALIQAAGGSAFVYGISSGAALALEAATRGLNIPKLALYEPPFIVDDTRPKPEARYKDEMVRLVAEGKRGDAVAYFMTEGVGQPPEQVAAMRGMPMWPMLEALAPTLVYDTTIMLSNQWFPNERAASLKIPVLAMDGGASPDWMRNSVKKLAATIPGAQYRTLVEQTHQVAAEALAPALKEFFL